MRQRRLPPDLPAGRHGAGRITFYLLTELLRKDRKPSSVILNGAKRSEESAFYEVLERDSSPYGLRMTLFG